MIAIQSIQQITVLGVGLIGSSLCLCLKAAYPNIKIVGWTNSKDELDYAHAEKIIDIVEMDLASAVRQADIVFLCTPVGVTLSLILELATLPLKKGAIVTDVSSTKRQVCHEAKEHLIARGVYFIGGHPMAGSHKSGVRAADQRLFENAYYILTPFEKQSFLCDFMKLLLKGTRAKFVELTPENHDEIVGMLSHLPHIIASGIVMEAKELMQNYPNARYLAAGGFRDTTRIASADPQMWTDILLSNQDILSKQLKLWEIRMSDIRHAINQHDVAFIKQFFLEGKLFRDGLPIHQPGAIPNFYDLYINVPDDSGVIAEITNILARQQLSLVNIKILETRDDFFGILQLTFKHEDDLNTAQTIIQASTNYLCFKLGGN